MFDKPQDGFDWGRDQGIVALCPKHKKFHDKMIECPDCKREKKPYIFKNVIWPDDQNHPLSK